MRLRFNKAVFENKKMKYVHIAMEPWVALLCEKRVPQMVGRYGRHVNFTNQLKELGVPLIYIGYSNTLSEKYWELADMRIMIWKEETQHLYRIRREYRYPKKGYFEKYHSEATVCMVEEEKRKYLNECFGDDVLYIKQAVENMVKMLRRYKNIDHIILTGGSVTGCVAGLLYDLLDEVYTRGKTIEIPLDLLMETGSEKMRVRGEYDLGLGTYLAENVVEKFSEKRKTGFYFVEFVPKHIRIIKEVKESLKE